MRMISLWMVVAACTGPTPTGTPCADPDPLTGTTTLTWENFGQDFMVKYCNNCHSSTLMYAKRNGAPVFHDFNTLEGVMDVVGTKPPDHIDEQAGWGPKAHNNYMPGDGTNGRCPTIAGGSLDEDCPMPSGQERTNLAQWISCERYRPHNFPHDAGVDSP